RTLSWLAKATPALPCVDRFNRGLPLWIVQSPQGEAAKPPFSYAIRFSDKLIPLPHSCPILSSIPPQGGLQANSGGGRRVWPLPATQVRVRAGWGERPQSAYPRAVPKTGTPRRLPSHYLLLTRRKPSRGPSSSDDARQEQPAGEGQAGASVHLLSPPPRSARNGATLRTILMTEKTKLIAPRLPRGFEDRTPGEIAAVGAMIDKIRKVYERYGFDPVETPLFEYTETLGKFLPDTDRPNAGVFSLQDRKSVV